MRTYVKWRAAVLPRGILPCRSGFEIGVQKKDVAMAVLSYYFRFQCQMYEDPVTVAAGGCWCGFILIARGISRPHLTASWCF